MSIMRDGPFHTGTRVSSKGSERRADLGLYCRSPCGSTEAADALPSRDANESSATSNKSRLGQRRRRGDEDEVIAGWVQRRLDFKRTWRCAGRAAVA